MLRIAIKLLLNKPGKMRAEHAGLVRSVSRTIVAYDGIFAQTDTERDYLQYEHMLLEKLVTNLMQIKKERYLLRKVLQMSPNKGVTPRMKEYGETPRIPKGNEMRFPRIEFDWDGIIAGNTLSRLWLLVNTSSQRRIEVCF